MGDEKKVLEDLQEVRRAMDRLVRRTSSAKAPAVRLPTDTVKPPASDKNSKQPR